MFHQIYDSNNRKFCIYVTITCKGEKTFRCWAEDYGKPNSKYVDRKITVKGKRTIYFSFPVSPKQIFIGVANAEITSDKDFEVSLLEGELKTYNIHLDANTRNFLELAVPFCQICGFKPASQNGIVYKKNGFTIKYFDIIRDYMSGKTISTPARIGHKSGNIEISKLRFDKYTVPMRIMIILHEFSHVYKNPKMGLEISNEIGADINALYIYLGLGFSKVDAICVFANVFLKAQTKGNIERMRKIMNYIAKFEQEHFAERN